jgi:hypothetical protein
MLVDDKSLAKYLDLLLALREDLFSGHNYRRLMRHTQLTLESMAGKVLAAT